MGAQAALGASVQAWTGSGAGPVIIARTPRAGAWALSGQEGQQSSLHSFALARAGW